MRWAARLIRLFAAATLLTGALSAQDASGRLSARDAGKLYDQIAEWMESTAVVVPELARAGAPLAENVRQSAQLLKSGPTRENSALLYKLITNARMVTVGRVSGSRTVVATWTGHTTSPGSCWYATALPSRA